MTLDLLDETVLVVSRQLGIAVATGHG